MDPTKSEISLAEMDYKGAFSKGKVFPFPLLLYFYFKFLATQPQLLGKRNDVIKCRLLCLNEQYFDHIAGLCSSPVT